MNVIRRWTQMDADEKEGLWCNVVCGFKPQKGERR